MKNLCLTEEEFLESLNLLQEELINDIQCTSMYRSTGEFILDTLQMMKDNPQDFELTKIQKSLLTKLEKFKF